MLRTGGSQAARQSPATWPGTNDLAGYLAGLERFNGRIERRD